MRKILRNILYILITILLFYSYKYDLAINKTINNEIDDIARMLIPVAILAWLFIWCLNHDIKKLSTREFLKKWLVVLILALLWDKTFNKFILPLEAGFSLQNFIGAAAVVFQSYAITTVVLAAIDRIVIKENETKAPALTILFYILPPFAISLIVWLCAYPALMMVDSIYIWSMVQGVIPWHDIHPLTYTLMLKLLTLIWNSPACIALAQVLLTAFAIGFTGWTLQKIGLPRVYCWIAVLAMSLLPVTWIYAVTILKDTFYTMALLVFIDIMVLAVAKPEEVLSSLKWHVIAALAGLFAVLSRHNGILTVGGVYVAAVILFIVKKKRDWLIKAGCALVAIVLVYFGSTAAIKTVLGDNLKEQPYNPLIYTQLVHQIVCIYGEYLDELDDETLAAIDKYLNLEFLDPYLFDGSPRGYGQGFFFEDLQQSGDWQQINADRHGFFELWLKLVKLYPRSALIASQKLSSVVWYSNNYGFTTTYLFKIFDGIKSGLIHIPEEPKLPQMRDSLLSFLDCINRNWFFWRPAWALVMCLIFAYAAVTRKGAKSLFIILPTILNSLGLLIAVPYPDTRFVYINFYALIVFALYTVVTQKEPGIPQAVPEPAYH